MRGMAKPTGSPAVPDLDNTNQNSVSNTGDTQQIITVNDINVEPVYDPDSGQTVYPCPQCDKTYAGKHARSIWRRHLQDKHQIPLAAQPRRTRWDNVVDRPKTEEERRQRTLESKRRWARKNRADKKAKRTGTNADDGEDDVNDHDEDLFAPDESYNQMPPVQPLKVIPNHIERKASRRPGGEPSPMSIQSPLMSAGSSNTSFASMQSQHLYTNSALPTSHQQHTYPLQTFAQDSLIPIDPSLIAPMSSQQLQPAQNTLHVPRAPFHRAHSAPLPFHFDANGPGFVDPNALSPHLPSSFEGAVEHHFANPQMANSLPVSTHDQQRLFADQTIFQHTPSFLQPTAIDPRPPLYAGAPPPMPSLLLPPQWPVMQRSMSASIVECASPSKQRAAASLTVSPQKTTSQRTPSIIAPVNVVESGSKRARQPTADGQEAAFQLLLLKASSSVPNSPQSGSPEEDSNYLDDLAVRMSAAAGQGTPSNRRRRSPRRHALSVDHTQRSSPPSKRQRVLPPRVESSPPDALLNAADDRTPSRSLSRRSSAAVGTVLEANFSPPVGLGKQIFPLETSPPELSYESSLSSMPSMETADAGLDQYNDAMDSDTGHNIFALSSPGHPDSSMNLGLIPTQNGIFLSHHSLLSSPFKGQMQYSLK